MMRKSTILICVMLALARLAWSQEFWTTKHVNKWTKEELRRFVLDSPWVRRVSVSGTTSEMTNIAHSEIVQTVYWVRWNSAKTQRAAKLRLIAVEAGSDAWSRNDPEPGPYYEIGIEGPISFLDDAARTQLLRESYLSLKNAKRRIPLVDVQVRSGPEMVVVQVGKREIRADAIRLLFPREIGGQMTIPDSTDSVELVCKFGDIKLKTSFDLRRMITSGGRDL